MKRKPLRQIYEESEDDFPSVGQLFMNPLQLYNIKSREPYLQKKIYLLQSCTCISN